MNRKCILLIFFFITCIAANAAPVFFQDSSGTSNVDEAIAYLKKIDKLEKSEHWPNIDPVLLMRNLNFTINSPLRSMEGKGTNFCAYIALSYVPLRYDPLGFSKFIIELYKNGEAKLGKELIKPSERVRMSAGTLEFKGSLDINHLGQIWFLSLADHFKGYLNFFNKRFDEGDENTIWAATNFAKFNRMLRKLFNYKVKARGSDLIRPNIPAVYNFLSEKLAGGTVFLYLNNRLLYKKKHAVSRFGIPTHFVVLTDIIKDGDDVTIIYWDAGRKTLQKVSEDFLKKIIYGVSWINNKKKK